MPLSFDNKPTKLQAGDILAMDIVNDMISLERDGKPLIRKGGQGDFFIALTDGVQIDEFVELLADSCDLDYQELGLERDIWRFRFIRYV
jgi:hypothetical protein